jgi:Membrane protein TerC, possibly involved in tellurium resistance
MLELFSDPQAWLALVTLTALEIVLGIDNIIFISILVGRLPQAQREAARVTGLLLAMLTRIALLFSIVWLTRLTQPWFHIGDHPVSGRDLILFLGGLFLLAKSVLEIHHTLEGAAEERNVRVFASFALIVTQIAIIDIVFSLDSVFTAVGLARDVPIMVMAIVIAILVMILLSRSISAFVDRHPTIKVLALSFLILVGVALVAEGFHFEIPKGYLYFAMAFSVGVEMINLRLRALLDRRNRRAEAGAETEQAEEEPRG